MSQTIYDRLFVITDISINGNEKTKASIILRELDFKEGDSIAPAELIEKIVVSKINLNNTLLFNFVDILYLIDEFNITINIELTERWYTWPVPIFEIAERNLPAFLESPNWEEINYGFFVTRNNFRGRKELLQLKARWGYKEQFSLSYSKPNLGKEQKHGIDVGINNFRQHEVTLWTENNQPLDYSNHVSYIYSSFSAFIAHSYRPKFYAKHDLSFTYNAASLHEDSLRQDFYGSDVDILDWFNFQYQFEYDRRDYKIYPLHGYLIKVGISQRGLGLLKGFDSPKSSLLLSGSINYELAPRLYIENVAKVRLTKDENMPYLFRQALGYTTYHRGFELYTIDGNSYGISINNLKFNLLPTQNFKIPLVPWEQFNKVHLAVYTNLFFDLSYVQGKYYYNPAVGNTLQNQILYSTGFGIDLVSYYDQVYRFEFTMNSLGQTGIFFHLETPFRRW
ncbi:MAG: hypothetical protein K9H49_03170 [Bacteroidales bacterium]|nr:hypothetical protein [Bacteroidales bacterium]MCF8389621.1 hypothetical protein [Bacteroidales bacterium]